MLDVLSVDDSMSLMRTVLGSERIEAEEESAMRLVEMCVRLPLALRIVAERAADVGSLSSVVAELKASASLLDQFSTGDDERAAIRTVFDWSYGSLKPSEALAFRRIGLHAGPDVSALAVAVLTSSPAPETQEALSRLVGVNLLERRQAARYSFHDLLRLYAQERCAHQDPPDESEAAVHRILLWYMHAAEQCSQRLMPQRSRLPIPSLPTNLPLPTIDSYGQALDWCEEERINLVLAVRQANDYGFDDLTWQLAVALRGFFNIRKHWDDWVSTHRLALVSARRTNNSYAVGRVLNGLGTAMRQMGRVQDAIEYHKEALALRESLNDRRGAASVLDSLGNAYRDAGQQETAIDCYTRSLTLRREEGDQHGSAWTLNNLGETFYEQNRMDDAHAMLSEALVLRRTVEDSWGEGLTLHNLGLVYLALDDPAKAEHTLREAISVRRKIRDRWGIAMSLDAYGDLRESQGDPGEALRAWLEAATIFEEIQDPRADQIKAKIEYLAQRSDD